MARNAREDHTSSASVSHPVCERPTCRVSKNTNTRILSQDSQPQLPQTKKITVRLWTASPAMCEAYAAPSRADLRGLFLRRLSRSPSLFWSWSRCRSSQTRRPEWGNSEEADENLEDFFIVDHRAAEAASEKTAGRWQGGHGPTAYRLPQWSSGTRGGAELASRARTGIPPS